MHGTDGRMDGWIDGWMEGQTGPDRMGGKEMKGKEWKGNIICMGRNFFDVWTSGWMEELLSYLPLLPSARASGLTDLLWSLLLGRKKEGGKEGTRERRNEGRCGLN
ncbi:hypothetical protein BKA81DRAFT_157881 [Phyllosticta paracitricarpa]